MDSPQTTVVAPADSVALDTQPLNRFHVAAVTFLRARQLQGGARPRVNGGTHKVLHVALLEVLAGAVSWDVGEAVPQQIVP
jgi:DNA-directed RNA polymerase subunit K/omega